MALSIPTYGSGYTLAFLQTAAAKITPLMPPEKGLSSPIESLVLLTAWQTDVSSGAERGWLIRMVSGLHS